MNYRTTLIALSPLFLLYCTPAPAAGGAATDADNAPVAPAAQARATTATAPVPAQLESAYTQALDEAEKSRQKANATLEKARQELKRAEDRRRRDLSSEQAARAAERQEMIKMRKSLNEAHRRLREASREVARISRELSRTELAGAPAMVAAIGAERPVLGIILGGQSKDGVSVLGVSPDGPADRAGVMAGDVIVSIGDRRLAADEDNPDLRTRLREALRDIKADQAITVSVRRDGKAVDLSVVPKVREPLAWQSVIRLPSAPEAPADPDPAIVIEHMDIPEIDTDALRRQIDRIRADVDQRRALIEAGALKPSEREFVFKFDSDELSELGDFALQDVNAWFGMPLTAGLQLAAIDPDLGQYFRTERGVLVLKAKPDNHLQLHTGDVVLNVGKTAVNSPADLMRALRGYQPDDELELMIKRERKNRTLKVKMPRQKQAFISSDGRKAHRITITTKTD